MKKLLVGLMTVSGLVNVNGQTTSYGVGAGTGGAHNSFFGRNVANIATGSYNTGIGSYSMYNLTTGNYNSATGAFSLNKTTTGQRNVALGYSAMNRNTIGSYNTVTGFSALYYNTTGNRNVATGYEGLRSNTTGNENTAIGYYALRSNTTGNENLASGSNTLRNNTIGSRNVAIGAYSLHNNVAGSNNTSIGFQSGVGANYDNITCLGSFATATASDQVRIGASWVTSIGGYQNWTNLSDGRFKRSVKENVLGLDFVNALRPVSYYVDNEAVNEFLGIELKDKSIIPTTKRYQTGFIAQEVEATAKAVGFEHFGGVDAPENEKSHYGLRYAEFVVPLVKSVQELSAQNDEQTVTIENLKALIAQQQLQINELLDEQKTTLNSGVLAKKLAAQLYHNTPNPFTVETQINLFIPESVGQALLQICTIDGKQLIVKEVSGRNETSVIINGNELGAGIYLYTLIVDHEVIASKRMVLTK